MRTPWSRGPHGPSSSPHWRRHCRFWRRPAHLAFHHMEPHWRRHCRIATRPSSSPVLPRQARRGVMATTESWQRCGCRFEPDLAQFHSRCGDARVVRPLMPWLINKLAGGTPIFLPSGRPDSDLLHWGGVTAARGRVPEATRAGRTYWPVCSGGARLRLGARQRRLAGGWARPSDIFHGARPGWPPAVLTPAPPCERGQRPWGEASVGRAQAGRPGRGAYEERRGRRRGRRAGPSAAPEWRGRSSGMACAAGRKRLSSPSLPGPPRSSAPLSISIISSYAWVSSYAGECPTVRLSPPKSACLNPRAASTARFTAAARGDQAVERARCLEAAAFCLPPSLPPSFPPPPPPGFRVRRRTQDAGVCRMSIKSVLYV